MYSIYRTKDFEKSFKKLRKSGKLSKSALKNLTCVIDTLASGKLLARNFRDHQLHGVLEDYRECHIQSDVLLVYKIERKQLVLILVDIGSHSYMFK